MAGARKPDPVKAERPPDLTLTPCHGVTRLGANLIVIDDQGKETIVGRVVYCGKSGFDERGRPFECFNVMSVRAKAALPEGLTTELVRSLCQAKPPTYELSSGYHFRIHNGKWANVRDLRHVRAVRTFKEMAPASAEDRKVLAAEQDPEEVEF